MRDIETDVAIVGAGMSGLVAAVQASAADVEVTVLEKGARPGGSMYLSNGDIWTFTDPEKVREEIPHGSSRLQKLVIESLEDDLAWLEEMGIELTDLDLDPVGDRELGRRGARINPSVFTEKMVAICDDRGADVRLETAMEELHSDGNGAIVGVAARDRDGDRIMVRAESVVLATGGFQGDEELVERYITADVENLRLRANPWSTGDGFSAAREVGAKATVGLDAFYGHPLVAAPATYAPTELLDASQKYGQEAIALNRNGKRFTDESDSHFGEALAQDLAKRTNGRAYLVIDRDRYESRPIYGDQIGTMVERAEELGGRVAKTDSLDKLGAVLSDWEVNGTRAVETIEAFNEHIRAGEPERLDVPRRGNHHPIDTPPFYAVAVQPGITYTMGGIDVDEEMRVLRRASSSARYDQRYVPENADDMFATPFEGLYAAGVDVGNVSHRRYMGGLAHGLVTGRIAGANAAERAY